MVHAAARAIYDAKDLDEIAPARLRRFFLRGREPRDGPYRVVPEIRDLVKFRHFDLRDPDWPLPGDFHVILCRNVPIYFAEDERGPCSTAWPRASGPAAGSRWATARSSPSAPACSASVAPSIFRRVVDAMNANPDPIRQADRRAGRRRQRRRSASG